MRKVLLSFLLLLVLSIQLFFLLPKAFAQTPTSSPAFSDNTWQVDPEVTFAAKAGARSGAFLDWALTDYKWSEGNATISAFWVNIRNIIYAFLILFVLITAFILIITQGKSITFSKFIPRFAIVIFLITFSFALIQFIYQIADIIQLFFLKKSDGSLITSADLLFIGFNYKDFVGYRLSGFVNDESAFISLLLIKLTAITYYIMAGILLVRKIILWFFIIISPVFPLLVLFKPIRNTAKIWIGEFFRWVLYAPLFSIFLGGLVAIWTASSSDKSGIPLGFNFNNVGNAGNILYPTAINILLGGPGQVLSLTNSLNLPQTFALYVVALIMLWAAIILPFILLRIFLDSFNNFSFAESQLFKQMRSFGSPLFENHVSPPPVSPIPPKIPPFISQGMAKSLTFSHPTFTTQTSEIIKSINLSIPTLHDIGRFETSRVEVSNLRKTLEKIANPSLISIPQERQHYSQIRESLQSQKQKGDPLASAILSASNTVVKTTTQTNFETIKESERVHEVLQKINNPTLVTQPLEREEYAKLREQLITESQKGNFFASTVLTSAKTASLTTTSSTATEKVKNQVKEEAAKGDPVAKALSSKMIQKEEVPTPSILPAVNKVQQVSFDDYEAVKKMWQENYENSEVPKSLGGETRTREQWVSEDMNKITETINLLTSKDPERAKNGMNNVSHILPFLLIGGFSQTEVIAYLKAKQEAGRSTLSDIKKKEEEEETRVEVSKKEEEKPKEMQAEAEDIKNG